jgi:class 3 adenylate cyclase
MAARIQGLAAPKTVAISDAPYRLVQGDYQCQNWGMHTTLLIPIAQYRIVGRLCAT